MSLIYGLFLLYNQINDQNIRQLLYASDLLKMSAVESACFTYMTDNLTVQNCVRSLILAQAKSAWRSLATAIRNCSNET